VTKPGQNQGFNHSVILVNVDQLLIRCVHVCNWCLCRFI